jgi:hypothetical protein
MLQGPTGTLQWKTTLLQLHSPLDAFAVTYAISEFPTLDTVAKPGILNLPIGGGVVEWTIGNLSH